MTAGTVGMENYLMSKPEVKRKIRQARRVIVDAYMLDDGTETRIKQLGFRVSKREAMRMVNSVKWDCKFKAFWLDDMKVLVLG